MTAATRQIGLAYERRYSNLRNVSDGERRTHWEFDAVNALRELQRYARHMTGCDPFTACTCGRDAAMRLATDIITRYDACPDKPWRDVDDE